MTDLTFVIKRLRQRYALPEIPRCRICGDELSVQRIGGGEPTVYACGGKEDDPDRPGHIRSKAGRWGNSAPGTPSEFGPGGHYHDTNCIDRSSGGDSDVLALCDALARQSQAAPNDSIPLVQRTAPASITLAVSDDAGDSAVPFPSDTAGVCWSRDSPLPVVVPYVRADLVGQAQCQEATAIDELTRLLNVIDGCEVPLAVEAAAAGARTVIEVVE